MKTAPLLSIGMIFKDEARCLERCLQSLQPLRDAIPCELVMADTGSSDGSRAIAERYADEVFDFPWIDDFAAARNAVMDRCTGKWYFTVDCDEWLDADLSELLAFLESKEKTDFAFVVVRSYLSEKLERADQFSDLNALRLTRMSAGQRYVGAIHESWVWGGKAHLLAHTILHHDGYLHTDREEARKKLRRNLRLLRRELEKNPEDLRTLNECVDSSRMEPEHLEYIRKAVALVQKQAGRWEIYGGCILRSAVQAAREQELPELRDWIAHAEEHFSNSPFTQIDVQYTAFMAAYGAADWAQAARHAEAYRTGVRTLRADRFGQKAKDELLRDPLRFASAAEERTVQLGLANACLQNGQPERALDTLAELDAAKLSARQLQNAVVILGGAHGQSRLDTAPVLTALYDRIAAPEPDEQARQERLAAFDAVAAAAFAEEYREEEQENCRYRRPAYTAFAALADKCEAGRAARMMMAETPAALREWLLQVEDWQALPIEALERALAAGVEFPLAEKPLPVEVLDGLAVKLTHGENLARQMALALPMNREKYPDLQSLRWGLALAMASVRAFDWTPGGEKAGEAARPDGPEGADERPGDTPETGLAILRAFARVEAAALPALYAPELLTEENAALLPPLHRWGLYSGRAFEALDAGRPQEYLAALRRGFAACPGQKDMARFLLDRFRQEARSEASPELLALAEKVRGILAAYGPEHPAAEALRESDAYKQVAWLIEETPGRPVQ